MSKSTKKRDNFSWDNLSFSSLECELIEILVKEGFPFTIKELVKRTKTTESGVYKALRKLEIKGLVVKMQDSVYSYYLNPYRANEIKRFSRGIHLGKNQPLVLYGHAFAFEAVMNNLPKKLARKLEKDGSFRSYRPSGWKYAYRTNIREATFSLYKTKSGSKILFFVRTFGFSPEVVEEISFEKFFDLKCELENKYLGLKIGTPECLVSCSYSEYAILKDPIAVYGIKHGIKHKNIEQSFRYPEYEVKGRDSRRKARAIIDLNPEEVKMILKLRDKKLKEDFE